MAPQPPCALRVTGGTGPSAALGLLAVTQAMPSESRLAPGPVALVTRLAPLLGQAPREGLAQRRSWERELGTRPTPRRGSDAPYYQAYRFLLEADRCSQSC